MSKDITIVAIDTYAHELTRCAIDRTLEVLPCKEVLVFSDKNIYPDGRWVDINPVDIVGYNTMMVKHLWPFVRTEHILVVQYDGLAVDSQLWTDEFLDYDYIGAIWPWPHHTPEYKVGNGGFSLRSRKLIEACKNHDLTLTNKLPMYEDLYMCVHYKKYLEGQGIKFADIPTAQKFSHEHHPGHKNTFGFHGTFNVPYYLDDKYCEKFVELLPSWSGEGVLLMVAHCFQKGNIDLGLKAMEQGRRKEAQFDLRLRHVLSQHASQFDSEHFQEIYRYLK